MKRRSRSCLYAHGNDSCEQVGQGRPFDASELLTVIGLQRQVRPGDWAQVRRHVIVESDFGASFEAVPVNSSRLGLSPQRLAEIPIPYLLCRRVVQVRCFDTRVVMAVPTCMPTG